MASVLVRAKLIAPTPRPGFVERPRLDRILARNGRLVVVSAPAGFGKTTEHLRLCDALGERAELPQNPYGWRLAMAMIRESEGDLDTALLLLTEAERVYVGDYSPDVRPIAAMRARILAAHGHLAPAVEWARGTTGPVP